MSIQIRTLADFKRFLALPGATLTPIRHDFAQGWPEQNRANAFKARRVTKLQTKAVMFDNEVWMDLESAKTFQFNGSDEITMGRYGDFSKVVVYKLSIT